MNEQATALPIRSLEALQLIVDTQRHRIVTLLRNRPRTAKELAVELGIGRTRLYYHLDLLQKYDIVRVAGTKLVSGLAERSYIATARNYYLDRAILGDVFSESDIADAQAAILDHTAQDLRIRGAGEQFVGDEAPMVARTFLRIKPRRLEALRATLQSVIDAHNDEPDEDGECAELTIALFTVAKGGAQ